MCITCMHRNRARSGQCQCQRALVPGSPQHRRVKTGSPVRLYARCLSQTLGTWRHCSGSASAQDAARAVLRFANVQARHAVPSRYCWLAAVYIKYMLETWQMGMLCSSQFSFRAPGVMKNSQDHCGGPVYCESYGSADRETIRLVVPVCMRCVQSCSVACLTDPSPTGCRRSSRGAAHPTGQLKLMCYCTAACCSHGGEQCLMIAEVLYIGSFRRVQTGHQYRGCGALLKMARCTVRYLDGAASPLRLCCQQAQ
jgi:hypothetical protein